MRLVGRATIVSGAGLTCGYSWASHSGEAARSMNSASSASRASPARRPASRAARLPERVLRRPPQLGDAVIGLLHPAPGAGHRLVHRVVEAVGLGVAQHAECGLVAGDDRTVVEAPAVAELGQREAGLAAQQEHETDHAVILADRYRLPSTEPTPGCTVRGRPRIVAASAHVATVRPAPAQAATASVTSSAFVGVRSPP